MILPYQWLVRLNRGHYKFKRPSDDPIAYSRWEYDEGRKVWERFFAKRVGIEKQDVLDLGCGPGGKTCFLATLKPKRVVGGDFASDLIQKAEQAREILLPPEDRIRVEFVCIDATDLPFPDKYFDIITCSDAFEHFSKPEEVFKQAVRVLKPGGLLAIDFAQWGSYNGHHLGDFLKTPWSHVFWSETAVSKTVKILAKEERDKLTYSEEQRMLDDLLKRRLDQFHNGLNHLSLARFEHFIRNEKQIMVRWQKKTSAFPYLWPLIFIPGLRELAVARNVYILERAMI